MNKMKILIINCGSSSIKYKLYAFPKKTLLSKGLIEKIGEPGSAIESHVQGVETLIDNLLKEKVIGRLEEIAAVGHRVVHGGETFRKPHIIDKAVIEKIEEYTHLAPLHNPANLAGIIACTKILRIPQVAVFDTAFYQTIPEYAYRYPIARRYYQEYGIRKYGFHGTSHQFVAQKCADLLSRPFNKIKLITCHLGNGCSITAVDKGKAVDTSMGFTPLEGLMMGTRCGDIDVAAVFHIMEKEKIGPEEMNKILNKKSGLLGVSGLSNDIRVIKEKVKAGCAAARLALEMFIYRIKKYIGAYYFILGGADAVCFTAGIGENNRDLVRRLKRDISKIAGKRTQVLIIPTDEELMIANLSYKVIAREGGVRK